VKTQKGKQYDVCLKKRGGTMDAKKDAEKSSQAEGFSLEEAEKLGLLEDDLAGEPYDEDEDGGADG
jgi:hypothetical protein